MPIDRARKQHVRAHQAPGESYTAALRRLTEQPPWELDGQGLGSTEYAGHVDGRDLVVTFAGDHKRPWTGWWDVVAADTELDEDEDGPVAGASVLSGRYRFAAAHPGDDQVQQALTHITLLLRRAAAGTDPETVSAEHGAAVAPGDVDDGGAYFAWWDEETWSVVTVVDFGDEGSAELRLDCDVDLPADRVTWDPDRDGGAWVDDRGHRVGLYDL